MTGKKNVYFARLGTLRMAIVGAFALSLLAGLGNLGWAGDADDAAAAVQAYHQALAAQDSAAVRNLLAEDAIVLESGHAETFTEYMSHHLGADMEFASQVSSERSVYQAVVMDDVAWVSSTSQTKGTFREHEIHAAGVELMVLSRIDGAWKIRAIHWSSRNIK